MKRLTFSLFLLLLAPPVARAHDFWIEPSTFRPAVGVTFTASLRVGQDFIGDAVPRTSSLIERFVVRDSAGERAIGGFENQDPAGYVALKGSGPALIGYRSKQVKLELPATKFEEYLRLEGLEQIIDLRARRGESAKPDSEIFSRCAKAIVMSSGGPGTRVDAPLGFRLEIVPQFSPVTVKGGLKFQLLYEGRPLAGAQVTALRQDGADRPLKARTDAKGRVTFALPASGVWLIKSVHMIPASASSGADWESLWASLTFER